MRMMQLLLRQSHKKHSKKCSLLHFGPSFLLLLLTYCLASCCWIVEAETEIKWTPNEQDQQAKEGQGGQGSGPLPLSNQQRQQLLQLDQVIQSSTNPQETLAQAAAANEMSPQDLLDILIRNRNDMAQSGSGGGMTTRRPQNVLIQCLTSLLVVISRMARHHPQTFSITTIVVVLLLYTLWQAPRTGLILSSARSGLLSHGPTTMWSPPNTFLRRLLLSNDELYSTSTPVKASSTMWKEMQDLLEADNDDKDNDIINRTVWHTVGKRTVAPSLQQAASCQVTIDMKDLLMTSSSSSSSSPLQQQQRQRRRSSRKVKQQEKEDSEDEEEDREIDVDDEEEDDEQEQELDYLLDVAYDQAFRLLLEHHGPLTEFVNPPESLRFVTLEKENDDASEHQQQHGQRRQGGGGGGRRRHNVGLLVVSGMGNWKRHGIVPMQVTQQSEDFDSSNNDEVDDEAEMMNNHPRLRLTWSTLRDMSHWDGHLQIQVEKKKSSSQQKQQNQHQLVVRVLLLVPNKNNDTFTSGRKIASRTLALHIVQDMAHSIANSIQQRTALTMARQLQSTRYRGQAHGRAEFRRASRSFKERQMEEMATDRRRRWQRQNPNTGHYRPSGTRMQSPNNAVYH